jgi:L-aspartate semialdehyde sulfurtransferase ferredoxin
MITVTVDEKACVGCSLCADICSTKVLSFNEAKAVAEVVKPKECFGCLACAEICPSDAIDHTGVIMQDAYYHDPYALHVASRLTTGPLPGVNVPTDKATRDAALRDLGVRLLSVAAVFKATIGAGLPAVGTLAGRTLAGQLPRYKQPKTIEETLALAQEQFFPAWELQPTLTGDQLGITVKACFVRELCQREGIALGGELCILFYNYLAGYLARMGNVKPRLVNAERGEKSCKYEVKLY